jgi:hypothetical protein
MAVVDVTIRINLKPLRRNTMSLYRFTSEFKKKSVDVGTVRTITQEAGGEPGEYNYTPDGKDCLADGPSMGLSNLQRVAHKHNVEVEALDSSLARADAGDATTYQVTITMDDDTVRALEHEGYSLFGFKAVAGGKLGKPVVWFATQTYSQKTPISWQEQYAAYISLQTDIQNGVVIEANNTVSIDLGQTFTVDTTKGTGTFSKEGVKGSISIGNAIATKFTCGVSQPSSADSTPTPTCVFPLHGNAGDVLTPIEKVLLLFATEATSTGTVIEQAFSAGILIDLTGAPDNKREVSYKIDVGWEYDTKPLPEWVQLIPFGTNITSLLIQSSNMAAPAARQLAAA